MTRRLAIVFTVLALLGFIIGGVALWWWALAGMSEPVGQASALTAFTLVILCGIGAGAAWSAEAERQDHQR